MLDRVDDEVPHSVVGDYFPSGGVDVSIGYDELGVWYTDGDAILQRYCQISIKPAVMISECQLRR
jgi:hypothetical protein